MKEATERQDRIDSRAAEWVVRLGGAPLSPAERSEFYLWLAQHPDHTAAFREAQDSWRMMGLAGNLPAEEARLSEEQRNRPFPFSALAAHRARTLRRRPIGAAVAASLVFCVVLSVYWYGNPLVALTSDLSTAPGAHMTASLPDGSIVDIGPDSAIDLHYSGKERRVKLLSGVAYFTVAPIKNGETRPFTVEASDGEITALGTQFMVRRLDHAVDIIVAEHDVEVVLAGRRSVHLSEGKGVRYNDGGLGPVHRVDVGIETGWRRGRIAFASRPLSEVIGELNRYRRGRIVLANRELSSRAVSGIFDASEPDAAVETIARELQLRVVSLSSIVTILY